MREKRPRRGNARTGNSNEVADEGISLVSLRTVDV